MKLNSLVSQAKFSIKKHSPEILIVGGVVGVIGSMVMACKATLKATDILEEHKARKLEVETALEEADGYTEEDAKKDNTIIAVQTAIKIVKAYAPAVILGGLSLGAVIQSNNILRKRNVALSAAYATLDQGFKQYRKRVVEKIGEEAEQQLRMGTKVEEIEEETVDENGKKKKVKKKIEVADPNGSIYLKYLTRGNPNWEEDEDYMLDQLNIMQSYLNNKLIAKKYLTLNEAYEELGFKTTKAGMVVGWRYDLKEPTGDNYVQLSVKKVQLPDDNGNYQKALAIDFNVDGCIYDKM